MAFTPRLNSDGMQGSRYWYSSSNPFYAAGYGLPNCTCYAFGRFWEISDPTGEGLNVPHLPTGDAGTWFPNVSGYETGQTPQLGAVACWANPGEAGHVGIVEEIHSDGSITCSNSDYGGAYFRISNHSGNYNWGTYIFQGFIYNPFVTPGPGPGPQPQGTRRGFKFVLSQAIKRRRAYG